MKFKWLLAVIAILLVIACKENNQQTAEKTNGVIENKSDNSKESNQSQVNSTKKRAALTVEQQIAAATLAAPIEARQSATVYGYNDNNEIITLKEGSNAFICIADNPNKEGFEVVSYHKSLEPYMAEGRDLVNKGADRQKKDSIREAKALSGKLKMPEHPATLHIYYGKNGYYNPETGKIENAKYRYVVYVPYATQESTGLSLKPNKSSHPWLMFPGKYNAHIMITPSE